MAASIAEIGYRQGIERGSKCLFRPDGPNIEKYFSLLVTGYWHGLSWQDAIAVSSRSVLDRKRAGDVVLVQKSAQNRVGCMLFVTGYRAVCRRRGRRLHGGLPTAAGGRRGGRQGCAFPVGSGCARSNVLWEQTLGRVVQNRSTWPAVWAWWVGRCVMRRVRVQPDSVQVQPRSIARLGVSCRGRRDRISALQWIVVRNCRNSKSRNSNGGNGDAHAPWHSYRGRCGGSPPTQGRAGTARPPGGSGRWPVARNCRGRK